MAKGLIQTATWRSTTLIVSESALILGAVVASVYLRIGEPPWPLVVANILPKALVITSVCQLCLYYGDLYDNPHAGGNRTRAADSHAAGARRHAPAPGGHLHAVSGARSSRAACWRRPPRWWSPRVIALATRLCLGDPAGRSARAPAARRHEHGGLALARELQDARRARRPDRRLRRHASRPRGIRRAARRSSAAIDDIPAIVRARSVDRVVVSLADARGKLPMEKLLEMKLDGVTFDHLASVYEEYTGKIAVENLRPSWLIFSPGFRKTRRLLAAKRAHRRRRRRVSACVLARADHAGARRRSSS